MDLGVFLPIGNNGWLMSTAAPQYMPTYELNRAVTLKAESIGFEFALSMTGPELFPIFDPASVSGDVTNVADMTELAVRTAGRLQFAAPGQTIVIAAGMPFGTPGSTNLLRIAQVD